MRVHVLERHGNRAGEARPARVVRRRRIVVEDAPCAAWFVEDDPARGGMRATADRLVADTVALCAGEMKRWVLLSRGLLSCAEFPGDAPGVVSVSECVRAFYVFLGSKRWRAAKAFWSALLPIVLTGHWRGCCVTKLGPSHDAGHRVP